MTQVPIHLQATLHQFKSGLSDPVYETGEAQYLRLGRKLLDDRFSEWKKDGRTQKWTRSLKSQETFIYDVRNNALPVLTVRKMGKISILAINEMMGYWQGISDAKEFDELLGVKTWYQNANETPAWVNNPHRKGDNDMGRAYGVQLHDWKTSDGRSVNQLREFQKVAETGNDNRRLILTYVNPGELDKMSLPACLHTLTYQITPSGLLSVTASQRSVDYGLGLAFNMIGVAANAMLVAQSLGLRAHLAKHEMSNVHIYEDHIDQVLEMISRTPLQEPTMTINRSITFEELITKGGFDARKDVSIIGYNSHEPIKMAMTA